MVELLLIVIPHWMAPMRNNVEFSPPRNHREFFAMTIHPLIRGRAFDPETIAVMVSAFEDVLRELRLTDRADPATELIARKVIEFTELEDRDPVRLREQVVRSLSK